MIPLNANGNVDNSDLVNYPDGRIRDNDGTNNGTGVNRSVYGDLHSTISKLMRLYAITPTGLPDNETNGFQIIESLRGLASKNDLIYPLSTNGTILNVDIKFSQMLDNEFIVCLAAFNKGSETQIKGIGATTFAITYSGNFKTNEYVRVIKTSGGVSIIRLADALSLDAMVADYSYLKKASQAEENAGEIDTVATTPLVNKVTYTLRTIGANSVDYLATALRNGLYPKEHFSIVAGLGSPIEKNYGTFTISGFATAPIGTLFAVSGDINKAEKTGDTPLGAMITITFDNAMSDISKMEVMSSIQSLGEIEFDNDIRPIIWNTITSTTIRVYIEETGSDSKTIKIHLSINQR